VAEAPGDSRGLAIAGLAAGTLALFALTSVAAGAFRAHVEGLAAHWAARGEAAMRANRAGDAVEAYENAQHYARNDPGARMRLAQALLLAKRGEEARSHLLALRARAPGDGPVNLALARLSASEGRTAEAAGYFETAVHGSWDFSADVARRVARQELIALHLRTGALRQAEAHLIALAPDLPRDADTQTGLGRSLLKTGNARRALKAFEAALAARPRDAQATAGAGEAAFRLAQYPAARRHLRAAAERLPDDEAVGRLLETTEAVLTLDPLLPRLRAAERARRVALAWRTAMARLQACAAGEAPLAPAHQELAALEPRLTASALRRNPEDIDVVMDAVFGAERAAESCGPLAPADEALLLIARRHAADEP
jgi:tetratricopeptide (TPR) repeat protein